MSKILFVEDNDEIRENASEILELAGYDVIPAANGKIGYEMALEALPDIIICDIMMPILDGYGLLALINKNDSLSHIPFIFLTAKTTREDLRKGMEMGADDYITKPFTELELLNAIEIRLKKRQKQSDILNSSKQEIIVEEPSFEAVMSDLFRKNEIRVYDKKKPIYSEGSHPQFLYYLFSGKARAYKMNEFGKELTVNLYKKGDFVGYKAILEKTSYKESSETMEKCEIVPIKRSDFEELIDNNRNFALEFAKILAVNISEKEELLMGIAYNSLRKRVADAILRLLEKYKEEHHDDFTMHISREDLAHLAGTTTESLIRTLTEFKNENLIEAKAGMVKVINEVKLRMLVN